MTEPDLYKMKYQGEELTVNDFSVDCRNNSISIDLLVQQEMIWNQNALFFEFLGRKWHISTIDVLRGPITEIEGLNIKAIEVVEEVVESESECETITYNESSMRKFTEKVKTRMAPGYKIEYKNGKITLAYWDFGPGEFKNIEQIKPIETEES